MNLSAPTAIRGNFIPVSGPSSRAASPSRQRPDVDVHIHLNLTDPQMDRLAFSYVACLFTPPLRGALEVLPPFADMLCQTDWMLADSLAMSRLGRDLDAVSTVQTRPR